jgi:phospholipid/cholesterol/gamma-HCH transport system substrate-binding protein
MGRTPKRLLGAVVAVAAIVGGYLLVAPRGGYHLRIVMPNAANLLNGSRVEIKGRPAGKVTRLETRDGKALVTVTVDGAHAPLHAGTTAQVQWRGVLGERVVELQPAASGNPVIPSGSMISAGSEQVELDQVLAALDPATRAHLDSTVQQLDQSLKSHSGDLRNTLRTAGPAVQELGAVLKAVGQDGPAIKNLIADLRKLMDPLAARHAKLRQTFDDLTTATSSLAAEQNQLRQALGELPSTLGTAKKTMDGVPAAVDSTVPLLRGVEEPEPVAGGSAAHDRCPAADPRLHQHVAQVDAGPAGQRARRTARRGPGGDPAEPRGELPPALHTGHRGLAE